MTVKKTSPHNHQLMFVIALLTIPLSGICIDLYTPSLPAMMDFFHTKESLIQMTIPLYLAGFGLFQLFAGPLIDAIGCRYPLVIALFINVLIALMIPQVTSIHTVLFVRVLQGAAVATSSVAAKSIVIDLYSYSKPLFLRRMSLAAIMWGAGPIIAPGIGGVIQHYFNWQMNFYVMALYIFLVFLGAIFIVHETHKNRQSFHIKKIIMTYAMLLKNKTYLAYTVSCGPLRAYLSLFAITAPFLIQKELGLSAISFGNLALMVGAAWLCGSITCRSSFGKHTNATFYFLFAISFILTALLIIFGVVNYLNYWWFAFVSMVISFSASFIFTHHFSKSLSIFPKEIGGSANALSSSVTSITITLISILATFQSVQSTFALGVDYFLILIIVILLYLAYLR